MIWQPLGPGTDWTSVGKDSDQGLCWQADLGGKELRTGNQEALGAWAAVSAGSCSLFSASCRGPKPGYGSNGAHMS